MATQLVPNQVGMMRGYCKNTRCAARDVEVWLKLYDEDHPFTAQTTWYCPRCRQPLAHVGYLTGREHAAESNRRARVSVNVQRYKRDHCPPSMLPAVPATIYEDESLPE